MLNDLVHDLAAALEPERLTKMVLYFAAMVVSLVIHEMAHAWTAYLNGDSTAAKQGRLSLNPLVHLDLVGSVLLPLFGALTSLPIIGWAKPVPVNVGQLRRPRLDHLLVALAGPAANLTLCLLATLGLVLVRSTAVRPFLQALAIVNAYLGVFNLIPLPPLDGSTLITSLMPSSWAHSYYRLLQPVSMLLLFVLLTRGGLTWVSNVSEAYLAGAQQLLSGLR